MKKRPITRAAARRLGEDAEARLAAANAPRCDGCGHIGALTREEVEGIVCERCDDCRQRGIVP